MFGTHQQNQIKEFKNVKTDLGKGRAWIRIALMESSLESYVRMFLMDETIKLEFYERYDLS